MSRPICPISGLMLDIEVQKGKSARVVSHKGRWTSRMFNDAFEAAMWAQSFNLAAEVHKAQRVGEGSKMRLRGKDWFTMFMTAAEIDAFIANFPEKKATKKAASKKDDA